MRYIDQAIIDAASSRTTQTPCVFVDVYASTQARVAIDSSSQWTGTADPMKASDSNVSFTRVTGAVTLAAGNAVSHTTAGTAQTPNTISMTGYTQCNYSSNSAWWRDTIYTILGYDEAITAQVNEKAYPFLAASSYVINSIALRASYSSVGVGARNSYAYFADSNGVQIGAKISFTPTTSQTQHILTGFNATIVKTRNYFLVIGYDQFASSDLVKLGAPSSRYDQSFTLSIYPVDGLPGAGLGYVPTATGVGFSFGGNQGYQASGSLVRQMDMGVVPTTDGLILFTDIVPTGTTQTVTLYYTDSAVTAAETTLTNWTSAGAKESGGSVTAHRYWRAQIVQTANTANDEAPVMLKIEISYKDEPITIGTHKEAVSADIVMYAIPWVIPLVPYTITMKLVFGSKGIDNISMRSAQMNPKLATSMIGKMTITLTPDATVIDMMGKQLRGKIAEVRVGFVIDGTPTTDTFYRGIVSDASWNGSRYTLTLQDDLDFVDVKVPTEKAGNAWSAATDYSIGDIVTAGTNSWEALVANGPGAGGAVQPNGQTAWNAWTAYVVGNIVQHDDRIYYCILANTNIVPIGNPTKWTAIWLDNGTVWATISYSNEHLCDIAKDLLENHINLPTQRVDLASIDAVKAASPLMMGARAISKPVGAIEMLSELAWLLSAQWIVRNNKLALILEPPTTSNPVGSFTDADIEKGLNYRRGWADLKNACLILSGYSGDGDGNEQYFDSYLSADQASILSTEMTGIEVFKDRWDIGLTQLQTRADAYVARWKNGRRVLSFGASMRTLSLETGDVVTLASKLLPPHDRGALKYIIVGQDIDWLKQTMKYTLMEL